MEVRGCHGGEHCCPVASSAVVLPSLFLLLLSWFYPNITVWGADARMGGWGSLCEALSIEGASR